MQAGSRHADLHNHCIVLAFNAKFLPDIYKPKIWMKHQAIQLATHRPRTIYALMVLLAVLLGSQIPRITIDTDPENMLSEDQADRVFHNLVEERFGLYDAVVVGLVNETDPAGIYNVDSLRALHTLSGKILGIDGVVESDVMSLAVADNITQGSGGALRFEWMMKDPPVSADQALRVGEMVARLPLLQNTLVSGDGRAAAIYVPIESKDLSYRISGEIDALAAELGGEGDVWHITGLPVAEDTFGVEMFVQMGISAPLAGLMIFLLMWYFFRSPRLIVAPMIVAIVTIVATMGLMIGLGFTVHIMSSMIPIFLMPIAVVDSVHIMSEFADAYSPEKEAKEVIGGVVEHLFTPMLFTSLTSAVGFASLLLTPIPPVQVFGAFVAIGILLAFVLTVLFIPAYVVRMPAASLAKLGDKSTADESNSLLARVLRRSGRSAFARGKFIVILSLIVFGIGIAGVMRIQINDNPVRWFKPDHRIRIADRVLNEHFAGTYDAFLVLEYQSGAATEEFRDQAETLLDSADIAVATRDGLKALIRAPAEEAGAYFGNLVAAVDDALFDAEDGAVSVLENLLELTETVQVASKYFQRPEILTTIEKLQRALMDSGGVGKTNALSDVVKVVNRELHTGEDQDYRIPGTVPAVAQLLLQFQSSHRPQDLWHMVTPDFQATAIWVQLKSGDNQDMSHVMDFMARYLAENPLPDGVTARWAGKTFINVIWQRTMVTGMLKSLLGAFIVVFLMMSVLFRSVRFGLLAMLPLTATILIVHGLIGWTGKFYDMPVAVLSSLTLGLSVDFAIHFIERMRSLYRQTGSFAEAARLIFEAPGRAITRNAIVIAIGFTPLLFAPLMPYVTVGVFMASIMAISAVATLILLPAVMSVLRSALFGDVGKITKVME